MNRKLFLQPNLKNQNKYDTRTLQRNFDKADVFIDPQTNLLNVNTYTIDEADEKFQENLIHFLPGDEQYLQWNATLGTVQWIDIEEFDVIAWLKSLTDFGNNLILTYDEISDTFIWKEIETWLTNYSTTIETNSMINSAINTYDSNLEIELNAQYYTELQIDDFLSTINFNVETNTDNIADLQTLAEQEQTQINLLQTNKEDDLLLIAHTDQEVLIWDVNDGIKWIDNPAEDLSSYATIAYVDNNFQTKLQFLNNQDIAIWDGINEIIDYIPLNTYNGFDDYYIKGAVDELLDEKENILSQYTGFEANAIAIPNGTLNDIEWVNIYTEYLDNYVEVASLNYLLSLYLLKTDAETLYQSKLQFVNNEDIAIWDGVNEIIDYIELNTYSGFDNYYINTTIDQMLLDYVTLTYLQANYSTTNAVTNMITNAINDYNSDVVYTYFAELTYVDGEIASLYNTLANAIQQKLDITTYNAFVEWCENELNTKQEKLNALTYSENEILQIDIDGNLQWIDLPNPDLSAYATISYVDNNFEAKINWPDEVGNIIMWDNLTNEIVFVPLYQFNAFVNYYTKTEINALTDNYYTKSQVDAFKDLYLLITDFNTTISDYSTTAQNIAYLQANYYTKTQIDNFTTLYLLISDFNTAIANYYTKTEINTLTNNYYTKTEINTLTDNYYTKTEINTLTDNYYTKTQCDNNFEAKINWPDEVGNIIMWDNLAGEIVFVPLYQFNAFVNYYTKTEINTLTDNYYTKTQCDNNFEAKINWPDEVGNIIMWDNLTNEIVFVPLYQFNAFVNYYTKTEINTLTDNYYTKTECDNTFEAKIEWPDEVGNIIMWNNLTNEIVFVPLYQFNAFVNYYTITQTDDLLAAKQDDLLGLTHSANEILAMNATNDALVWTNPGSADIEAYMTSLSLFGNLKIFSYNGTEFNWYTPTQMSLLTPADISGKCDKLLSNSNYQTFEILNNTSSSYHFTVKSSAYEYLKIYYNQMVCKNGNYDFYDLGGSQRLLYINASTFETRMNQEIFYNNNASEYYAWYDVNSNFYRNNQHYFRNSANNTIGLINNTTQTYFNTVAFEINSPNSEGNFIFNTDNKQIYHSYTSAAARLYWNISNGNLAIERSTGGLGAIDFWFGSSSTSNFGFDFVEGGSKVAQIKYSYAGTDSLVIGGYNTGRICEFEYNDVYQSYIASNGTFNSSDKNRKCNVTNKEDCCFSCYFDEIGKWFHTYSYLHDETRATKLGYIAQDIQKFQKENNVDELKDAYEVVNKKCVDENGVEHENELALDYNHINIFCIKTLHNKIKCQQNEINELIDEHSAIAEEHAKLKQQNQNMQVQQNELRNQINEIMQLLETPNELSKLMQEC